MQCIYLLGKCGVLDRSQRKKQQFTSGWEQPKVTWWLFNVPSLSEQREMPCCWTSAQECSSSCHELTEPWFPCPALFLSQFINFLVWWNFLDALFHRSFLLHLVFFTPGFIPWSGRREVPHTSFPFLLYHLPFPRSPPVQSLVVCPS